MYSYKVDWLASDARFFVIIIFFFLLKAERRQKVIFLLFNYTRNLF